MTGTNHVVHNLAELGGFIRLRDDTAEAEVLITAHGCVSGITTGNDRVNGWIYLDKFLQRFLAAHTAGQGQVQDNGIEPFASLKLVTVSVHAFERGGRAYHLITKM